MSSISAGIVLPEAHYGDEEWKNADAAQQYVEEAVAQGAEIVFFPEGYPGPATGPLEQPQLGYEPIEALCETARDHGVWITASDVEQSDEGDGAYSLTLKLISPSGEIVETYRRMQPDTPPLNAYLYNGKAHFVPGDDFVVRDVLEARLGLLICSELWVPELARVNMVRGANVLYAPVHGVHSPTRTSTLDTFHCIARARAAENCSYVVVTQNVYHLDGFDFESNVSCGAFVATPEEMLATRDEPGVLLVDLDMDRLEYIRNRNYDEHRLSSPDDGEEATIIGSRPGQIWERNPELYEELAEESEYSLDYEYYAEELDSWIEDYERIYDDYEAILDEYGMFQFDDGASSSDD